MTIEQFDNLYFLLVTVPTMGYWLYTIFTYAKCFLTIPITSQLTLNYQKYPELRIWHIRVFKRFLSIGAIWILSFVAYIFIMKFFGRNFK
ncbi:hypothetical protein A9Q84_00070 [Halobacteriovorax marinus]|uniref:Uncharacterized protein n=1 Tax=Halobacteriovorax marinus TaxID=97084 RepID=A0A1Y5FIR6_9BACT|nr:hypothetical protein A9Q84_00070 [Halobacteriovorax marinus]